MHKKAFKVTDQRYLTVEADWYNLMYHELLEPKFGTENELSISPTASGTHVLLTNWEFPKLRAGQDEQAVFELNWGETKQLRDFLDQQLAKHATELGE